MGKTEMQRLSHEVEHLVNSHREATEYGETIAEWEALDNRLAQTEMTGCCKNVTRSNNKSSICRTRLDNASRFERARLCVKACRRAHFVRSGHACL